MALWRSALEANPPDEVLSEVRSEVRVWVVDLFVKVGDVCCGEATPCR